MQMPLHAESIDSSQLGDGLADDAYLRQRIAPCFRDVNYLYLADLLAVTKRFAAKVEGDVFDYGCGGSPYRHLFSHCRKYVGADVTPGPAVDCLLNSDGLTQECSTAYDAVLSSQVLEHISNPHSYLTECFRILKPGGRLLVTTHGMFEEHGCPYDFHRWTSRGLNEAVEAVGFEVVESFKLTTQIRGSVQLLHKFVTHLRCPERRLLHLCFAVFRKFYSWLGIPLFNRLGRTFDSQSVVAGADVSPVYLGVAVTARKPQAR
jgi:SAM-dependent methyltransferase